MKFDALYNQVFLTEADEDGIPMPEDFDDVAPAPVPATPEETEGAEGAEPVAAEAPASGSGSTLKDYVDQLEEFADKINGVEGSLQALVAKLDKPGTAFDGISQKTSSDIVRVAEVLLGISENLKSYIINSAKS